MQSLGIDTNNLSLAYEGSGNWGYPLWPAPTVIAVAIVDESSPAIIPDIEVWPVKLQKPPKRRQRFVSTGKLRVLAGLFPA